MGGEGQARGLDGGNSGADFEKGVRDYRGVTVIPIYKIYMAVLAERLKKEVEGKGIIPDNQTGFRKGMGTINNIYVLNYLINRQTRKKGGKLVALFVELRAALDSVDQGILIGDEGERDKIREGLVKRVEKILRETKSRVRLGGEVGNAFWTRWLRQGCPLSPLLFNILIADLEEEMRRIREYGYG